MKKLFVLVAAGLVGLGGCVTAGATAGGMDAEIERVLKERPELVLGVLKDNPQEFMAVLQSVVEAQEAADQQAQKDEAAEEEAAQAQIQADIETPFPAGDIDGRVVLGDPKAKLVVVMYSDTQCPYCRRALGTMLELMEQYPVRVIYKHLAVHKHAAAMGAYIEAAGEQGSDKAGALIRAIYTEEFQARVNAAADPEAVLRMMDAVLKEAGGDPSKARVGATSERVQALLAKDEKDAEALGFNGTPGFIAAGVRLNGAYPAPMFAAIFDHRLGLDAGKEPT